MDDEIDFTLVPVCLQEVSEVNSTIGPSRDDPHLCRTWNGHKKVETIVTIVVDTFHLT